MKTSTLVIAGLIAYAVFGSPASAAPTTSTKVKANKAAAAKKKPAVTKTKAAAKKKPVVKKT